MTIRVKREEFLSRLQSVQAGLSARDVVEQSSCFVFRDRMVYTYNDEVSCRSKTSFPKSFVGAVAAKPLIALLQKMPEEDVELEMSDSELKVVGVKRRAGIRVEKEILLAIEGVEEPSEWRELPAEFADALEIVSACAGTDDSFFTLTCVHIAPKFIESCDNLQMARFRIRTGVKAKSLVRAKSLKQIAVMGMTEIAETDSWLHFRNSNGLVYSCRRFLEDFPDLTDMLDVEGEKTTLPGGLGEAVDRASIFASDNATSDRVKVSLRPGKVRITGQGTNGTYTELKKVKYDGPAIEFMVAPKLLIELNKRHNACEINQERLKVEGERYVYIACLQQVDDEGSEGGE